MLRGAEQSAKILEWTVHPNCILQLKRTPCSRSGKTPDQATERFGNLSLEYFLFLNIRFKYLLFTEAKKIPFISPCCCPFNEVEKHFIIPVWQIYKHQNPKLNGETNSELFQSSWFSVFLADIAISHFSFAATDTREISFYTLEMFKLNELKEEIFFTSTGRK